VERPRPDGTNPDVGAFEFQRTGNFVKYYRCFKNYTELAPATQIAPAATYYDDVSDFASGDVLTITLSSSSNRRVVWELKLLPKFRLLRVQGSYYILYDGFDQYWFCHGCQNIRLLPIFFTSGSQLQCQCLPVMPSNI
jgi:hypothetical protein